MAIAFDAASSLQVFTGNTSWTHTPAGTPAGALVIILQRASAGSDQVSGVTYGGISMSEVPPSPLITAPSGAYAYFLSNPPSGGQTVAVTTSGSTGKRAISFTVTASGPTAVVDADGVATNVDDPSVTLAAGADTAWVASAIRSNTLANLSDISPPSSFTSVAERDDGADTLEFARITSVTSGNIVVTWPTTATSEVAMIAVAIIETEAGAPGVPKHILVRGQAVRRASRW